MRVTKIPFLLSLLLAASLAHSQPSVSFTFDDPEPKDDPLYTWQEKNEAILGTLKKHRLTATLFVCGHRVDHAAGKLLLGAWDKAGHQIASHSYAHRYYHSEKYDFASFRQDFEKNDSLIAGYRHYTRLFRFPYLKEGNTIIKRDSARALLRATGYHEGYVSIDASDWYVNQLLTDTLQKNPSANLDRYRQLYLQHILERAAFYDSLAFQITARRVKHTLLLHHNLTSALFLDDLILAFHQRGWKIIATSEAWNDPIYRQFPDILPAGESIIWALAKASGQYESILRYPGEDSEYEQDDFSLFLRNGNTKTR